MRESAGSSDRASAATRGELSLLVERYGDCTLSKLGTLTKGETRALIKQVFFEDGLWDDVQADESGCIMPLAVEAEHALLKTLNESQAFKELFASAAAEPPISAHTFEKHIHNALPETDQAGVFVGAFAQVAVHALCDLFGESSLFHPSEAATPATEAPKSMELMVLEPQPAVVRRRMVSRRATAQEDVQQQRLDWLLTTYCDFRNSRAPSLSERDKDFLRLRFLWGKDLRSMSRASGMTYQRAQQVVRRAVEKLQEDLLAQKAYQVFWAGLHRLCVVSSSVLSGVVMAALGDQEQSVDKGAIGRFLLQVLKSDVPLHWYTVGHTRLQCCAGTQSQLNTIVAYVREVRGRCRGPVSNADVSAVCMFILGHSQLPSISVPVVAADLLAAVSPPSEADQLEALLTRLGSPSHFADLARNLDDAGSRGEVSAEYVHAVLGRDTRFAWSGLGTYALTAWGYPRATSVLGVVLHMIRTKGSGVTWEEIKEFMFVDRRYNIKLSSVRIALKAAEGRRLRKVGMGVWDALVDVRQSDDNEVTEHE